MLQRAQRGRPFHGARIQAHLFGSSHQVAHAHVVVPGERGGSVLCSAGPFQHTFDLGFGQPPIECCRAGLAVDGQTRRGFIRHARRALEVGVLLLVVVNIRGRWESPVRLRLVRRCGDRLGGRLEGHAAEILR